jgi:sec-independent protein translocase protein TatC
VFLQLVGLVTPRTLTRQWRYAIMGIFVAAALITPSGDPFSLLALAIPLSVLYVLSVIIGWLLVRRRPAS